MDSWKEPAIEGDFATYRTDLGALAYSSAGADGQFAPVLLVHGWCSNRHSLARQFEHYRQTRRVVALDLAGHGDSQGANGPYRIERFAQDVAGLCRELGLDQPVLMGHSMGGAVIQEAQRLHPELASALVLLDGYGSFADAERNQLGEMLLQQVEAMGLPAVQQVLVEQFFFVPGSSQELRRWVVDNIGGVEQEMAVEAYRDLLDWDGGRAAAGLKVPVLNLVAEVPFNPQHRYVEVCAHAIGGQTVGAGHFHVIEAADQVHSMIDAFLARSRAV